MYIIEGIISEGCYESVSTCLRCIRWFHFNEYVGLFPVCPKAQLMFQRTVSGASLGL